MSGGERHVFPAEALPALPCLPVLCSLCSGIKRELLVTRDLKHAGLCCFDVAVHHPQTRTVSRFWLAIGASPSELGKSRE